MRRALDWLVAHAAELLLGWPCPCVSECRCWFRWLTRQQKKRVVARRRRRAKKIGRGKHPGRS